MSCRFNELGGGQAATPFFEKALQRRGRPGFAPNLLYKLELFGVSELELVSAGGWR